jgi:hypothetical protein
MEFNMTAQDLKEFLEELAAIGTELRRPSLLPATTAPSILDLMGA